MRLDGRVRAGSAAAPRAGRAGPGTLALRACVVAALVYAAAAQMSMPMGSWVPSNDACVVNPGSDTCTNYVLTTPTANADLNNLCTAMSFMVGCSVRSACYERVNSAGVALCDPVGPLAAICSNDGTMYKMQGCGNWNRMCNMTAPTSSQVASCSYYANAAKPLLSTSIVNAQVQAICNDHYMADCDLCMPKKVGEWLRCDIMSVYGKLCAAMPEMPQCSYWSTSCAALPGAWPEFGCPEKTAASSSTTTSATAAGTTGVLTWAPLAAPCLANPSAADCAPYMLPAATVKADTDNLCQAMSFMVGCSLRSACAAKGTAASGVATCDAAAPMAAVCANDGMMSRMQGCGNWNRMCNATAGSVVAACANLTATTKALPTSDAVNGFVQAICANDSSLAGCSDCPKVGAWLRCDIMKTYGKLCAQRPGMPQCASWASTCEALPGNWPEFSCPTKAATSVVAATDACIKDPTQASCSSYVMPASTVAAGIDSLCTAMPFMVGCSLKTACAARSAGGSGALCDPIAPMAAVCSNDGTMYKMQGCASWNTMCSTGTKVPACPTYAAAVKPLLTTDAVNAHVLGICGSHFMDGCDKCTLVGKYLRCDTLAVYGQLCAAMPEMPQCQDWAAMCSATPGEWPEWGCPSKGGASPSASSFRPGPSMIMYFHTGINEYILFKQWVPKTDAEFAGACLALFFLAMFHELLVAGRALADLWSVNRARRRLRMARRAAASKDAEGGACPPQTTFQWWSRPQAQAGPGPVLGTPAPAVAMKGVVQSEEAVDASGAVVAGVHVTKESCPCSAAGAAGKCIKLKPDPLDRPAAVALLTVARRFGFRLVTSGIGYFLMLVAMTYNAALFCSIIAGFAFGSIAFGWIPEWYALQGYGAPEDDIIRGGVETEDCCT